MAVGPILDPSNSTAPADGQLLDQGRFRMCGSSATSHVDQRDQSHSEAETLASDQVSSSNVYPCTECQGVTTDYASTISNAEDSDDDEGEDDCAEATSGESDRETNAKKSTRMPSHESRQNQQEINSIRSQTQMARAVAFVLGHLSSLGCPDECSTTKIFDSASIPQISVQAYGDRLGKYFACSEACFVLALVYIDRLVKMYPGGFVVSNLNIHRLFLTSLMVASKFHDDVFYSNAYYSKVGGIKTSELNRMEAKLIHLLQWKLLVESEEYEEYFSSVHHFSAEA